MHERPWDEVYRSRPPEELPWYTPALDADFARALDRLEIASGRALDIGCGPGTQSIGLAERGFEVVATDLSPAALAGARRRAEERKARLQFVENDILKNDVDGPFVLAIDRGCFHVFDPPARPVYARTVAGLLAPGGWLFLKCFSEEQPGTEGPHRLSPLELRGAFAGALDVVSIDRSIFEGTIEPHPKALFCLLRKPL